MMSVKGGPGQLRSQIPPRSVARTRSTDDFASRRRSSGGSVGGRRPGERAARAHGRAWTRSPRHRSHARRAGPRRAPRVRAPAPRGWRAQPPATRESAARGPARRLARRRRRRGDGAGVVEPGARRVDGVAQEPRPSQRLEPFRGRPSGQDRAHDRRQRRKRKRAAHRAALGKVGEERYVVRSSR